MKNFSLVGIIAVALAAGACSLATDTPAVGVLLSIDKIEAPERHASGTPLDVVLTVIAGSCRVFEGFITSRTDAGASVIARGRDETPAGGSCTADVRLEPRTVRFNPPFQSTFTVTALRPSQDPLTATVLID